MRALEECIHAGFAYGYSYCKDHGQYKASMLFLTNRDLSDESDKRNVVTVMCRLHTA